MIIHLLGFIDTAGSPTSPVSPMRRKTSERKCCNFGFEELFVGLTVFRWNNHTTPHSTIHTHTILGLTNVGKIPSMVHFGSRVVVVSVASGSRHTLALSSTGDTLLI